MHDKKKAMEFERLRADCEELLQLLHLPHRFKTRQLLAALADYRGHPVKVKPMDTGGRLDLLCGMRAETTTSDVLYYERQASPWHRNHIVAHEVGHVLWNHPGSLRVNDELAATLDLDPAIILRLSGRSSYSDEHEQQAEYMATLIRRRMYLADHFASTDPQDADDRWDAVFGRPLYPRPRKKGRRR